MVSLQLAVSERAGLERLGGVGPTYVQHFGHGVQMAGEVPLHSFWDTLAALSRLLVALAMDRRGNGGPYPTDQHELGQTRVWVFDFDERKLDLAIAELLYQVFQLALCNAPKKKV